MKPAKSHTTLILGIARRAGMDVFHTPDGEAHASLTVNGHRETHALSSSSIKGALVHLYYEKYHTIPNDRALEEAITALKAEALYKGPQRAVHLRVGRVGDRILLDLGRRDWKRVRIGSDGWEIVESTKGRFCRPRGMLELALPKRGGSVDHRGWLFFLLVLNSDRIVFRSMIIAFSNVGFC